MARYDAGETLASIARTYDCSPPAISYVVSRSRDRQPAAPPPSVAAGEPQLIKAPPPETPLIAVTPPASAPLGIPSATNGQAHRDEQPPPAADVADGQHDGRDLFRPRPTNGFAGAANGREPAGIPPLRAAAPLHRPAGAPHPAGASGNGDPRHTLHLSLGGPPHRNDATPAPEPPPAERLDGIGQRQQIGGQPAQQPAQQPPSPAPEPSAPPTNRGPQSEPPPRHSRPAAETETPAYHRQGWHGDGDDGYRKNSGAASIDNELRARVDGDIAAFLTAFDAALAQDTQESRLALREATDRLLRAGARTRIELERLEARVPLPPRDNGRGQPAWRQR